MNIKKLAILGSVVISTFLIAYVFFQFTTPLLAQEKEEDQEADCKKKMSEYINTRTKTFGEKIDGLLLGQDPNSQLLDQAMITFREFRSDVLKEFEKNYLGEKKNNFARRLSTFSECLNLVDESLNDAQQTFMNLTTLNSHVKQSARLLTKFRALNDKLRNLVYQFGYLKGQFDSFATRIPYWSKQCN